MKTRLRNIYLEKLAALNDQLCFFLFNREELNQKLKNFSTAADKLYTTDLFSQNPYAKKIRVIFKQLPKFQDENQTLNFGAYFSFSYEFFSSYIDDIISILGKINGVTLTNAEKKKNIEEQLLKIIEKCGSGLPNIRYFETLTYCRLRRNYFTHILENLNNPFLDIVNNKGTDLNTFWSSAINKLDFTKHTVNEFSENETIELIKILRITLEEIDNFITPLLLKEGIAKYICKDVYEIKPTKINIDVIAIRKLKVRAIAKRSFGVDLTDTEMHLAVSTIGIK